VRHLLIVLLVLGFSAPAFGVQPGEALSDPAQEDRARSLMAELRCLVCQAESVEASPAPFAAEVRAIVREQVAAGRSNGEIKRFLTQRYGEEILYRPSMGRSTWALWLGPFLILGVGALVVVSVLRRARGEEGQGELTADERARLDKALKSNAPPDA